MSDGHRPDADDADQPEEPAVRPAAGRRNRDPLRAIARGLGQVLITAGMVVLLFVVYEVYVTDLFGHQKQEQATSELEQRWNGPGRAQAAEVVTGTGASAATAAGTGANASGAGAGTGTVTVTGTRVVTTVKNGAVVAVDPATRKRNYRTVDGQGFAKISIPSFGADYVFTIIEGTNTDDLYVGPGHYKQTQYPGEPGNFAVAGHRVSKGSPFNNLGQLASCDAMVLETQSDWFVYRVLPMQDEVSSWAGTKRAHCAGVAPQQGAYAGTFGREITDPSDYAQVLPVPHAASRSVPLDAERLLTLTTCHPQFSDAQRMIIHGTLVKSYPKANGFLPPELNES